MTAQMHEKALILGYVLADSILQLANEILHWHFRNHMSTEAVKMYMFSLILSHINYCLPPWSTANSTTLKLVMSLYKQALKILDKKPKITPSLFSPS